MNSAELLARYREAGTEEAFEELVRRYADLVFSVAKRRLGNSALAEEAAQTVFMRLATKKPNLPSDQAVLGWLHRTTLHVSIDLIRSEARRRIREEKSMQTALNDDEPLWDEIVPFLDEALDKLKDEERAILLLRFFDRKPFAQVGAAFGISEDAAKMRVARALEKLRDLLGAEKVLCTATVLGGLLLNRAVEAAPVGLTGKVLAHRAVLSKAAGGVRVGRREVLVGTASLLLIGTLLVKGFRGAERKEQNPVDQGAPVAASAVATTAPQSVVNNNAAIPGRKFDPVTTRTVLTLRDAESGAPIAGGRVRAAYFYAGGVGEGHKGFSDMEGQVAIPFPNKEGNPGANIFVTADGYVPEVMSWSEPFPEAYEVKLDPALTFAGQVVDEDGQPVPDVRVTMTCPSIKYDRNQPERVAFNSPETASVTDESGAFHFPYVPREIPGDRHGPGEVRFILTADGFAITETNFPAPLVARSDLKFVIRRGFAVAGRVLDPQGQPVANVSVRELHNAGVRKLRTRTDDDGRFTLNGVWHQRPEKRVSIVVEPDDWASQEKSVTLTAQTNVIEFTLEKSPVFRGRVIDEDGRPLPEVTVRTDSDNHGILKYEWLDVTNIDGRFEWAAAPREPTLFWFEKDGYEVIREMELTPNGTEYQITLRRVGSTRKR